METFSLKSRYLRQLKAEALSEQMEVDAQAALDSYGGELDIRRPSLRQTAMVRRVRLVYEGGELLPMERKVWGEAIEKTKAEVPGVEVLSR